MDHVFGNVLVDGVWVLLQVLLFKYDNLILKFSHFGFTTINTDHVYSKNFVYEVYYSINHRFTTGDVFEQSQHVGGME